MTSGKKYWSNGTAVAGQQFEYTFDDIGNRKTTASGGDQYGGNLRSATYTANSLNQYSQRTVPSYLEVVGSAATNATVTVNAQTTYRKGEYFRKELSVDNSSGPVWQAVTNIAVVPDSPNPDMVTTNTGNLLLAKATEAFIHDADGNLISDSLWTNRWNGENRRTNVESQASVATAGKIREGWSYLPDGRWIQRIVSTNNGSSWVTSSTNRYVWDGQVLLAMLDHTNGVVTAFLRGLDLSGSPQGAGGVGGVLAITQRSTSQPSTAFYSFDGNGNVSALLNVTDGTEVARYEYDPFGQTIRSDGALAKINPIRLSTQYADDNSGDLRYLYRDYRADLGRWVSRDPIGERGGLSEYCFLGSDPVNYVDILGLNKIEPLPVASTTCCTKEKIAKGEAILNARFTQAQNAAKAISLKPAGAGEEGATCKISSTDIMEFLIAPNGFPPCWRCHSEWRKYKSRKDDPDDQGRDHQVIICTAYLSGAAKFKEIIFDWWGDTFHNWSSSHSGGSPDYFRNEYKYPRHITNSPFYTNCDGTPGYKGPPPKACFSGCLAKSNPK